MEEGYQSFAKKNNRHTGIRRHTHTLGIRILGLGDTVLPLQLLCGSCLAQSTSVRLSCSAGMGPWFHANFTHTHRKNTEISTEEILIRTDVTDEVFAPKTVLVGGLTWVCRGHRGLWVGCKFSCGNDTPHVISCFVSLICSLIPFSHACFFAPVSGADILCITKL